METEEIRTTVGWETKEVDRGLERVERAFNRMNQAEEKAIRNSQARQAQAAQREKQNRERALRDLEKMEAESNNRRVKATEDAYKRMASAEASRLSQFRQGATQNQIRAGITGTSSSAGGHGGGGGGHGGFLGGAATRTIGDALDQATGHSGWVMRLRGLDQFGPAALRMMGSAGAAGPIGIAAAAAALVGGHQFFKASGEIDEHRKAASRLDEDYIGSMRTAPFMTVGSGAAALGEERAKLLEQAQKETEHRGDLEEFERGKRGELQRFGNPVVAGLTAVGFHAADWVKSLLTGQDNDERRRQSDLRSRDLQANANRLGKERTEALGIDRDRAVTRVNGSRFDSALMESRLAEQREIAEAGKTGASDADKSLIAAKHVVDRQGIAAQKKAANDALEMDSKIIEARKNGVDEVGMAELRYTAAKKATSTALGSEERKAAQNREKQAEYDLNVAKREYGIRMDGLAIDRQTAQFRGNEDERARVFADAEVKKTAERRDQLEIAQGVTEEEKQQARLAADRAVMARDLLDREQAIAKIHSQSADRAGAIALKSSGAGLGVGQDPATRALLQGELDIATEAANAATKVAEANRESLAAIDAQHRAVEAKARAQLQLNAYVMEETRVRKVQLDDLKTSTVALHYQNLGRGDIGGLVQSRRGSDVAQYEALRDNNPALAEEIASNQQERETGMYLKKFYQPNGRKRRQGDVHREERAARRAAGRLDRAAQRFHKNGDLVDVRRGMSGNVIGGRDAITGEQLSMEQIHARKDAPRQQAEKDKAAGQKGFVDIWNILNERLPGKAAK